MIIEKAKGNHGVSCREVFKRDAAEWVARRLEQQEVQKRRNPHIDRAPLCRFFPKDTCSKGVSCSFKHDVSVKGTPRPSTLSETITAMEEKIGRKNDKIVKLEQRLLKLDYLKRAQRSQLEKNPRVGSAPPCRFFSSSEGCSKGDRCVFLHDMKDDVTTLRAEINKLHHEIRYLETGIVKMHDKAHRRPVHTEEDDASYDDTIEAYVGEAMDDDYNPTLVMLEAQEVKNAKEEEEARKEERLKKLEDKRIQREYEAACMTEMEGFGV